MAPEFGTEREGTLTKFEPMFDDGQPVDGASVPEDSIDRGNLSFHHYAGLPKTLHKKKKE